MKTTILPERLLEVVKTKQDANNFLVHINEVIANLFKSSSSPIDVITAFMPYAKKEWSLSLIHEHDLNITDLTQMQNFFQGLKDALEKMPVVEISLAFEPNEKFIVLVSNKISIYSKKPVILDINYNPKIIAGLVIGFKGNYKNYSMEKMLLDKQKNGEIMLDINV